MSLEKGHLSVSWTSENRWNIMNYSVHMYVKITFKKVCDGKLM